MLGFAFLTIVGYFCTKSGSEERLHNCPQGESQSDPLLWAHSILAGSGPLPVAFSGLAGSASTRTMASVST